MQTTCGCAGGICQHKGWLHKLGGLLQLGQCFGAMSIFGGLRIMGVRSCGSCQDETKARFHHATVRTVLVAARSPTSSGSHSGCTQWISTVGSVVVAYSTQSARISRVRMMAPRSGGARDSRSWHDLNAARSRMDRTHACVRDRAQRSACCKSDDRVDINAPRGALIHIS